MAAFLKENRLSFEAIQTFSTPRRLAVRVTGRICPWERFDC
ncbi:glycyl-tRNA synthetase beta subunit [Streptococcus pneumoniae]|nr:glycyl-tRNA synthetase beta subunit [Streptococcus pneumoniae]